MPANFFVTQILASCSFDKPDFIEVLQCIKSLLDQMIDLGFGM
jgi:hypothetical protein